MKKLAIWNPHRQVWEAPHGAIDLFSEHSEPFSETWPASGMTRAGVAFELPMLALPTVGSASSLLRTPRASRGASGTETMYKLGGQRDDVDRTQGQVLLKTPTSQLAINGGSQHPDKRKAGGHGPTLADEVEHLLPTPQVADATGGHASRSGTRANELLLPGLVKTLLPAPRASDGEKGGPNQRGSKGDLTMNSAVQLLPTPQAHDAQQGKTAAQVAAMQARGHGVANLNETVENLLPTAKLLPTPTTQDASNNGGPSQFERNTLPLNTEVSLLPTPTATYGGGTAEAHLARKNVAGGNREAVTGLNFIVEESLPAPTAATSVAEYETLWGELADQSPFWVTDKGADYWPAINRWAHVIGREAPSPTIPDGKGGKHRLNPKFTEWMMGLPAGHVTDLVIGLTRNQQLKALGNGVVPQQAELALRYLLTQRVEVAS